MRLPQRLGGGIMLNNIQIRPITLDDFDTVLRWSKDEKFCLANGWKPNRNPIEIYRWWQNCVNNKDDDFLRLGIEFNHRLVGYADLAYIKEHSAELGVALGERVLWGKGIGYHSCIHMMEYGFKTLKITTYYAETHEANIRARKLLDRLGFLETSRYGNGIFEGKESPLIQYKKVFDVIGGNSDT
jgi:[ribosomal protein S5]-alanine N-acetyltransferase